MIGYSYVHSAVDDYSRLAYSEVLADERRGTAVAFWQRAQLFFTTNGITVERVRTQVLADFPHTYNHHRSHTALGGQPPISRVNNLSQFQTWPGCAEKALR